jgi:hypothetical protein
MDAKVLLKLYCFCQSAKISDIYDGCVEAVEHQSARQRGDCHLLVQAHGPSKHSKGT